MNGHRAQAPEQGRLRYGAPAPPPRNMRTLDKWRATSHDGRAIEQIAAQYGGKPQKWLNPKGVHPKQWEVYTESPTVQVVIHLPTALSVARERWGGRGYAERRCAVDGSSCTTYAPKQSPVQHPHCVCEHIEGTRFGDKAHCKYYGRLNVILPCCQLGGLWRMEAKGQIFAHEAPGMIDLIRSVSPSDYVLVDLTLTPRQGFTTEGKRNFIVPVLSLRNTITELAEQQVSITSGLDKPLALEAGNLPFESRDDDITDAEIVD